MTRSLPRFPTLAAMALLTPLLLGKNKCKPEPPDLEAPIDKPADDINTPDVALQVVSLLPNQVAPQTPVSATLFGAGFQAGVSVSVGTSEVEAEYIDENTLSIQIPGLASGTYDVFVSNPDGAKTKIRSGLAVAEVTREACYNLKVYFQLDNAGLTSEARQMLGEKVGCLTEARGRVQIDGHADERGTTDYNVALGERRAVSVKRYLVSLGLPNSKALTTSYGEERPENPGHDEQAWAVNRRAEIRIQE